MSIIFKGFDTLKSFDLSSIFLLKKFFINTVLLKLLFIVFIFLLQACVPLSFYKNVYDSSIEYFNPRPFVLNKAIMNSPYAMQLVQNQNSYKVMVLAYVDDKKRLSWVDSEGNGFTTIDNKIISSNGLDNDLEIISPPVLSDIISSLLSRKEDNIFHTSLYKLSKPPTSYLEMEHNFSVREFKQKILKRTINQELVTYTLIQEKINVPAIRWQAINFYWVDEGGTVLKSKQKIAPNLDTYFLETLKDYNHLN